MRRQIGVAVVLALVWTGCGSSAPEIKAGNMPEGGNFQGVYFSQQYGEMNLIQNGANVVGEYTSEMRSGKIQGEVQGDLMRFEWTEAKAMVSNRAQSTKGHGYFRYMVDSSNGQHVLKGEWGLGDQETGGGPWNAYKQKNKEPKLSERSSSGGESEDEGSSGESEGGSEEKSGDDDMF
ncbi:MAG TPA: hypothetical protein VJV78_47440 [Polyangiales bacterium]|nr:hypothetical protein [Polyangiales bacterium]